MLPRTLHNRRFRRAAAVRADPFPASRFELVPPSRPTSTADRPHSALGSVHARPVEAEWPRIEAHLQRVSRSFAFCIARLEPPLREWVGEAYLLLRLLDTVEDSRWPDAAARLRCFEAFDRLLDGPDEAAAARWAAALPESVTEGERRLLDDAPRLFRALHRLPAHAREPVLETARCMSRGMRRFLDERGELALATVADVDRYCFFVAGIIGELLTLLFAAVRPGLEPSGEVLADAHRFGRFLQKINILKDEAADAAAGRTLAARGLAGTLRADADGALRYLLRIPAASSDYRAFCAWSLFLGLWTFTLPRGAGVERVSRRDEAMRLLGEIEEILADDAALAARFAALATALPPASDAAGSIDAADPANPVDSAYDDGRWMLDIYHGALTREQLAALGVVGPPR